MGWQTALTALIVLAAVLWLTRKWWPRRTRRERPGPCSCCSATCSAKDEPTEQCR